MSEAGRYNLRELASHFDIPGDFIEAAPFGQGHINDTYLARYQGGGELRYILQRINQHVFKEPEKVIENIERVTRHARARVLAQGGDPDQRVLNLAPARDGRFFHRDAEGNTWRLYHYVEGSSLPETNPAPAVLYNAARAFGEFQRLLADLPGGRLHETIPNFHHTPLRMRAFRQILAEDRANRAATVKPEIDFILRREQEAGLIVDGLAQGRLPERVTHNDTKISNVLIDDRTGEGLCVIDLDTVMPGSALYDFGDMVRAGAASAAEDEPDSALAGMDLDKFTHLARGYSAAMRNLLSDAEWDLLAFSAKLITFEQAVRFLGDHINGDTYYKIGRPGQNLDRARTQIRMAADMEQQMSRMEAIVKRCRIAP